MPVYTNAVPQTCRRGDRGDTVKFLQQRLNRNGAALLVDGVMGAKTTEALQQFQWENSLVTDGICGPITYQCLMNGGGRVVHYMQNDSRWKDVVYTSTGNNTQTIGSSGCGPSSLAIAMSPHGTDATPPELCQLAVEGGYRTANSGTAWAFFAAIASKYGRKAVQSGSLAGVADALTGGALAVASMGPDGYTKGGHYIVLRDCNPYSGIYYTLDPISKQRNSCTADIISKQSKQFWIVA